MRRKFDNLTHAFDDLIETHDPHSFTPERIRQIRHSVARSTREFEGLFQIPARTIEAYEQGRRKPDAATRALLTIIEKEPKNPRRRYGRFHVCRRGHSDLRPYT